MYNLVLIGLGAAGGIVGTSVVFGFWYKHNKKKLAKVLTYFDVQARMDELLAKTDIDEKLMAALKEIRAKVDEII